MVVYFNRVFHSKLHPFWVFFFYFLVQHPYFGSIFFPQPTGFPLPSRFIAGPLPSPRIEPPLRYGGWTYQHVGPDVDVQDPGRPPAKNGPARFCKIVIDGVTWGPYQWPYTWVSLCFFFWSLYLEFFLTLLMMGAHFFLGSQRNDLLIFFS